MAVIEIDHLMFIFLPFDVFFQDFLALSALSSFSRRHLEVYAGMIRHMKVVSFHFP
jgi:hypothetical protein